jgi:transcriptional regulator with XRE-family HTH domain
MQTYDTIGKNRKREEFMGSFDNEALLVDIADRLRELREERSLSMRTLAVKSGLSANALSMIERGKTSPSVSTLYKLAEAMGVPITTFFSPTSTRKRVVFIKYNERTRVSIPGGIWEGLGGEQFVGRVEPFILTLEPGAGSGERAMVHTGHEFVFCLRGNIEYTVEEQVFSMEAGDSILFSANLEHRWRNIGNTDANILIVLSNFMEGDRPSAVHLEKDEGE